MRRRAHSLRRGVELAFIISKTLFILTTFRRTQGMKARFWFIEKAEPGIF